jgi:hypothetical protein
VCVCMHVCMCVCVRFCMHACIYESMHVCMCCVYVSAFMCACVSRTRMSVVLEYFIDIGWVSVCVFHADDGLNLACVYVHHSTTLTNTCKHHCCSLPSTSPVCTRLSSPPRALTWTSRCSTLHPSLGISSHVAHRLLLCVSHIPFLDTLWLSLHTISLFFSSIFSPSLIRPCGVPLHAWVHMHTCRHRFQALCCVPVDILWPKYFVAATLPCFMRKCKSFFNTSPAPNPKVCTPTPPFKTDRAPPLLYRLLSSSHLLCVFFALLRLACLAYYMCVRMQSLSLHFYFPRPIPSHPTTTPHHTTSHPLQPTVVLSLSPSPSPSCDRIAIV